VQPCPWISLSSRSLQGAIEALLDVIVDQRLLGIVDCVFDCLELLGELATGPTFLDHGDDLVEVSVRPLEAA
jgi:hypothetical protein